MLQKSIQNLYEVFSVYKLNRRIQGCYCNVCLSEEYNEYLHSKPLKSLTEEELVAYIMSVDILEDDLNDFKYFIPRFLEFYAFPENKSSYFYDVIYGRVGESNYTSWLPEEVSAINNFFQILWTDTFQTNDTIKIVFSLFDLADAGFNISECLKAIENKGELFTTEVLMEILDSIQNKLSNFKHVYSKFIGIEKEKIKEWFLTEKNIALMTNFYQTGEDLYGRTVLILED